MTTVRPLGPVTYTDVKLPLPGLYDVVSWQLNVTMHQPTGMAKYVSIVREPVLYEEIRRDFHNLGEYWQLRPKLLELVQSMPDELAVMTSMRWNR